MPSISRPTLPGQPLLELRNVSKRFVLHRDKQRSLQGKFIQLLQPRRRRTDASHFWPLRDISFQVFPGNAVGVIGPNGSGKSTLLKLITRIIEPTSGSISVRGRVASLLELGAGFHPDLTGRENIYLNASIYGLNRSEVNQRLASIIDFSELEEFIDLPVKHYSSGMYVRLGFAVAIHTDPELLIVDEVLAVGDAHFQRKCMAAIHDFLGRGGTLFFVSHDLDSVARVCSEVIWLDDGYIRKQGQPLDVIAEYQKESRAREAEQLVNPTPQQLGEKRWGAGDVEITGIRFLNGAGVEAKLFTTGEPLTLEIHYLAHRPVPDLIIGLGIVDSRNIHICGPNTSMVDLVLPAQVGQATLTYTIPALALLDGSFSVSVAAHNQADTVMYDYHDRAYTFFVEAGSSKERYGLLTLRGNWILVAAGETPAPLSAAVTAVAPVSTVPAR